MEACTIPISDGEGDDDMSGEKLGKRNLSKGKDPQVQTQIGSWKGDWRHTLLVQRSSQCGYPASSLV